MSGEATGSDANGLVRVDGYGLTSSLSWFGMSTDPPLLSSRINRAGVFQTIPSSKTVCNSTTPVAVRMTLL